MIFKNLDRVLKKLDLPESADAELSAESIALLKEYGLYDESASGPEDTKADREVVD